MDSSNILRSMSPSLRVATLLALLLFVVACGAKQTKQESEIQESATEQTMLVAELNE